MTIHVDAYTETLVETHVKANRIATESLAVGQKFLGAYGVADKVIADRDDPMWGAAVQAAYITFSNAGDIYTDDDGVITQLTLR